MKKRFCLVLIALLGLSLTWGQLAPSIYSKDINENYFFRSFDLLQTRGYYDDVVGLSGPALKTALHDLVRTTHTTRYTYAQTTDQMRYTDEDPSNSDNVIEIYTGWSVSKTLFGTNIVGWNREHTWSKSHGDFEYTIPAGTDLHHLRPCDVTVNSAKGNRDFDYGTVAYIDASPPDGYPADTGCKKAGDYIWEPRDADKGDVARMIMYMAVRYEGTDTSFDLEMVDYIPSAGTSGHDPFYAKLATLLVWNDEDPPDAWELRRNERTEERQGNRNPFIDYPGFAGSIWGGIVSPTIVQFSPTTVTTNEAAGTVELSLQIFNPSPTAATSVQVTLSSGSASDIGSFSTRTITFPAGSSADQNVLITITDDSIMQGTKTLIFSLANASGGNNASIGPNAYCNLSIEDNDIPQVVATEATSVTFTGFTANWDASPGISDYSFDLSQYSDFNSYESGYQNYPVAATSLALNGLMDGSSYFYRLRAVFGSSNGGYSNVITVSTPIVITLSEPVATAATAVSHEGFTAHWNNVTGAHGYYLYVYEGSSPQATDLIISEYVEGSSSNKYLEIFNGTGETKDLADYSIKLFSNGASTASNTSALSGTLANGACAVYRNSSANLVLADGITALPMTAVNFNGDDAVSLYKVSTSSDVDIFGKIGFRPSTSWGTGELVTVDKTLRRKPEVLAGVNINPTEGFPTLDTEWDSYPINTADGLGSHSIIASSPVAGYSPLTAYQNIARVEGLDPSTQYSYRVVAFNTEDESGSSNLISVDTSPVIEGNGANTSISGSAVLVQVANLLGYTDNTISIDPQTTSSSDYYVEVYPITAGLRFMISSNTAALNGSYVLNHAGLAFIPQAIAYGIETTDQQVWNFTSTQNQSVFSLEGINQSGDLMIELLEAPVILAMPVLEISYEDGWISLAWQEVPDANIYRIEASDNPNSGFIEIDSTDSTSWTEEAGEMRFYRVRADRE